MTNLQVVYPTDWTDYELLDSGDGEKLERFGNYKLARPDPRAVWEKHVSQDIWNHADALYKRADQISGSWQIQTPPPTPWHLSYKNLTFTLRPTEFKHVGVFPEQASNWNWLEDKISHQPMSVLNLFAYTGGATMAAAAAGAKVTHVDAVKSTIDWANENVRTSKLQDEGVRWIEDDAYKFVVREAKRQNHYDGIIMDPPRFGHGTKGEIWKLIDDLPRLTLACRAILSEHPAFILINAYTADLSSIVLGNLLTDMTKQFGGFVSFGELALKETDTDRLLPNGIFARWSAK